MTKGVFLVAFGNSCYGRAAMNLALTIKHFDPDLPITLLHDSLVFSKGFFDMGVFDNCISLGDAELSNPAKIKTSIYKHLPYDYNLYLDVDALCLQSLIPLFNRLIESKKYYAVHIFETYDKNSPENMTWMYWAKRSTIWDHYKFDEHKLPACQSSAQFIKKCDESENLFKKLNENLEKPIPLKDLTHKWGGAQPDELYLNVTLAQLNIAPDIGKDVLFFTNQLSSKTITQIKNDYFIMSFFGGKSFARNTYKQFYDGRFMIDKCRARGYNHVHKIHTILSNKHADNKAQQNTRPKPTRIIQSNIRRAPVVRTTRNISRSTAQTIYPVNKPAEIDLPKPIEKISVAITNYNRLDLLIDSFKEIHNDERVSEIIISDDYSDIDLFIKLGEQLDKYPKVKLHRNESNIGMSLNKKQAVSLCENEWVILFDSDNILNTKYIARVYDAAGVWNPKIIYMPDGALPAFDYSAFKGIFFNSKLIKDYLNKPLFDCLLNTCNYFVNRDEYLKNYEQDETVKETDTIHYNYNWLKNGNSFYVVPGMNYMHLVHSGSGFMKHSDYNLKKAQELKKLISKL